MLSVFFNFWEKILFQPQYNPNPGFGSIISAQPGFIGGGIQSSTITASNSMDTGYVGGGMGGGGMGGGMISSSSTGYDGGMGGGISSSQFTTDSSNNLGYQ